MASPDRPLVRMVKEYACRNPHYIGYLGFVGGKLLPEVLGSLDVSCMPSIDSKRSPLTVREEQFRYVSTEAMASGLPFLATNCGSIPEVVGNCNILVKQGSPDALYRGLTTLLRYKQPRRRLSKENSRRVERKFNLKT